MVLHCQHAVLLLSLVLIGPASSVAADDRGEFICINAKLGGPEKGDTIACYSDAGCKYAASLGGEPIRDYDAASAPFALARGKIGAIVAAPGKFIDKIKAAGASCRPRDR